MWVILGSADEESMVSTIDQTSGRWWQLGDEAIWWRGEKAAVRLEKAFGELTSQRPRGHCVALLCVVVTSRRVGFVRRCCWIVGGAGSLLQQAGLKSKAVVVSSEGRRQPLHLGKARKGIIIQ